MQRDNRGVPDARNPYRVSLHALAPVRPMTASGPDPLAALDPGRPAGADDAGDPGSATAYVADRPAPQLPTITVEGYLQAVGRMASRAARGRSRAAVTARVLLTAVLVGVVLALVRTAVADWHLLRGPVAPAPAPPPQRQG